MLGQAGCVHVYCGDGKGKTTAAFGLALRMLGAGGRVLVGQFFKSGESSEVKAISSFEGATVISQDRSFGRCAKMSDVEKKEAAEYYPAYLEKILAQAEGYDLLVLDELVSAINHGFVDMDRVLGFLAGRPSCLEVVITGRKPDARLVEAADYVTCMEKLKHPYDSGVRARLGIEL
jgi:cob(I)alamin adenosyltransferase